MEPEKKPTHVQVKQIKDGTAQVEIGSAFVTRIQELLFFHVNSQPAEVGIKALNDLKTREPKDKFEYHLLTILSLLYSTENAFEEKGLTEQKNVPIPEKN